MEGQHSEENEALQFRQGDINKAADGHEGQQ